MVVFMKPFISDATETMYYKQIEEAITRHARPETGIEPALVKAIVSTESAFFPRAERCDRAVLEKQAWFMKSLKNYGLDPADDKNFCSVGACQILYVVAISYGWAGSYYDLMDPGKSVYFAVLILKDLKSRFKGDIRKMISAYNNGGAYFFDLDLDGIKDPGEVFKNEDYVNKVYKSYKAAGGLK
jgi:soluble lytic murein transglycosylase-like protein